MPTCFPKGNLIWLIDGTPPKAGWRGHLQAPSRLTLGPRTHLPGDLCFPVSHFLRPWGWETLQYGRLSIAALSAMCKDMHVVSEQSTGKDPRGQTPVLSYLPGHMAS